MSAHKPTAGKIHNSSSRKGKSAPVAPAAVAHTVDRDYVSTLQAQINSEKKAPKQPQPKTKRTPKVIDAEEEAIDADELKAAVAAARAEGGDDDSADEGQQQDGKKSAAGSHKKSAAAAAAAASKSRLIRRADESVEDYKLRLKSEMKRRKIERKKEARKESVQAQMARMHEEKLQRQAEKQREHQQRIATERAVKALKLAREAELEGLTNKQKREKRKEWAAADATAEGADAAAATTSAATSASSSNASTPAASTKKQQKAAATTAAATVAASSAAAASVPSSSAGTVSLSRPKNSKTTSTPTPSSKPVTLAPSSAHLPLPAHSAWDPYNLHPAILRALLLDLKFMAPTPIQEKVLLPAIRDWKDVSAAATTGSGKTLAFGLPIVHRLLQLQETPGWTDPRKLQALILTPTRELALQIVQHLEAVSRYASPAILVTGVVGGMALDKQKRVLDKKHPAIVVATPGRLWELINEGDLSHLSSAYYLRFLVLDEADRMVDFGHFPEIERILQWIERNSSWESVLKKAQKEVQAFDGFEMLSDEDEAEAEDEPQDEADADQEEAAAVAQPKTKGGKKKSAADDTIDWSSFVSEEEVFRQQGRKVPKEMSAVEKDNGSGDEDEEAEEGDEDAEDMEDEAQPDEDEDEEAEEEQEDQEDESKSEEGDAQETDAAMADSSSTRRPLRRQIFLFSATLMLSAAGREDASKVKHGKSKRREPATVLEKLADKISFQRNTTPYLVDLSSTHQVASTLEEVKAECVTEDKDYLVYYFLLMYPGKTLVFVNSISCLRRLVNLLQVLQMPALPLHAEMQQKARLKSLERFKAKDTNSILVCTDVAARGLDIPKVPYIVHYQLPRTPEIYIHRSGRVARAGAAGLSFALVSESEQKNYRRLCLTLLKPEGIPSLTLDQGYMVQIRSRMNLARQVDEIANSGRKSKSKREWFLKNAEAMEMEIDEAELQIEEEGTSDAEGDGKGAAAKDAAVKLGNLQRELDFLLAKPLMHGTLSRKFYTLNAARGFDIGRESAQIAKAGVSALAANGVVQPKAQNVAVGTQARTLQGLPELLKKARTDASAQAIADAANPAESAVQSKSVKKKKDKSVTPAAISASAAPTAAAAAAAAAAPAEKVTLSLSAKRKSPEASTTATAPAKSKAAAAATPAAAAAAAAVASTPAPNKKQKTAAAAPASAPAAKAAKAAPKSAK